MPNAANASCGSRASRCAASRRASARTTKRSAGCAPSSAPKACSTSAPHRRSLPAYGGAGGDQGSPPCAQEAPQSRPRPDLSVARPRLGPGGGLLRVGGRRGLRPVVPQVRQLLSVSGKGLSQRLRVPPTPARQDGCRLPDARQRPALLRRRRPGAVRRHGGSTNAPAPAYSPNGWRAGRIPFPPRTAPLAKTTTPASSKPNLRSARSSSGHSPGAGSSSSSSRTTLFRRARERYLVGEIREEFHFD